MNGGTVSLDNTQHMALFGWRMCQVIGTKEMTDMHYHTSLSAPSGGTRKVGQKEHKILAHTPAHTTHTRTHTAHTHDSSWKHPTDWLRSMFSGQSH